MVHYHTWYGTVRSIIFIIILMACKTRNRSLSLISVVKTNEVRLRGLVHWGTIRIRDKKTHLKKVI
jgi:hypothetical protein